MTFDPYHTWLGIPPEEQPPDHYRLLGLRFGESNETVISDASDRQTAHLRTKQHSEHVAESQRLLNEVSRARVCLLNPSSRAAYELSLAKPVTNFVPPPAASPRRPKRPPKNAFVEVAKVVVGGLAGVAIAALLVRWIDGRIDAISEQKAAQLVAASKANEKSTANTSTAQTRSGPKSTSNHDRLISDVPTALVSEPPSDATSPPNTITARTVRLYNTHNNYTHSRGTKVVNVALKADDQELWRRDNITVTWLSNKEEYTDIQLPNDVAFDTLRVEITEWARPGAGLSEMEIHDSAGVNVAASRRIFSNSHLVVRGVKRKTDFSAVALTDGITSSKTWGKGYWLAADNKHAWIEFRTKNE